MAWKPEGSAASGVLVVALATACMPATASPALAPDPGAAFDRLETRLLAAEDARLPFRITSEGAFTANLAGELRLGAGDAVEIRADGTFGADTVSLALRVAEGRMVGGNGDADFDEPVPPALREAVVLGLTRMGLLHNLARLVAGAPPDHAAGGVHDWIRVSDVRWAEDPPRADYPALAGLPGELRGVAFDLIVAGQEMAEAVLWLHPDGRPLVREQTVRFPGGEMLVVERYHSDI